MSQFSSEEDEILAEERSVQSYGSCKKEGRKTGRKEAISDGVSE